MPVSSIYESESYPDLDVTLWEAFEATVTADRSALVIVDGERRFNRGQLADAALAFAQRLQTLGVGHLDRVMMIGSNTFESVVAVVAASRLGATMVPITSNSGTHETQFIIDNVKPSAIICTDQEYLQAVLQLDAKCPVVDGTSIEQLTDPFDLPPSTLAADEIAMVGFTAGTTGHPKGVMLSSAALNYCTTRWAEVLGLVEHDKILVLVPISYLSGYAFNVHMALTRGLALVCMNRWSAKEALSLLVSERCAWSMTITSHIVMFLDEAEKNPVDLSCMRALSVGGSPIAANLVERTRSLLNVQLLRAYGMSECLGASITRPDATADVKALFDGYPIVNTDIEAFDEAGNILPRGEVGIAGVRGPSLFSGYWNEPELAHQSFAGSGFLMTGDLIVRSKEGHVRVVGRVKDFIIRGGHNIDPVEIENLIRSHSAVRDVSVVGYPDHRLGERVCACVVRNDGVDFSFEEMIDHLNKSGLSKHKLPERYIELEEIPMSDVGKPLKSMLRELAGATVD